MYIYRITKSHIKTMGFQVSRKIPLGQSVGHIV